MPDSSLFFALGATLFFDLEAAEGNFFHCVGALVGFAVIAQFRPTYISLLFYLTTVKIGHLASIAGIAITGPIFATALECLAARKPPSRYLVVAFTFFAIGFYILAART